MTYEEIIYEVHNHIATITLNRPDKLNAWTFRMEREYRHAMTASQTDERVRVIVVTGAGRGFCAGADMSLLSGLTDNTLDGAEVHGRPTDSEWPDDVREDFRKQYTFPPAIRKPIIGAINGPAVGLGLVHTLYFDLRFASDRAKFGTAFAQRGLIAEHGISYLLPRLVGLDHALDLLYSARIIEADEAKAMGLVTQVVPHDHLMTEVRRYATQHATMCSPRSLAVMKRQVWDALFQDLDTATEIANREMFASFTCDDFREGVQSFLEKRPPKFTGR